MEVSSGTAAAASGFQPSAGHLAVTKLVRRLGEGGRRGHRPWAAGGGCKQRHRGRRLAPRRGCAWVTTTGPGHCRAASNCHRGLLAQGLAPSRYVMRGFCAKAQAAGPTASAWRRDDRLRGADEMGIGPVRVRHGPDHGAAAPGPVQGGCSGIDVGAAERGLRGTRPCCTAPTSQRGIPMDRLNVNGGAIANFTTAGDERGQRLTGHALIEGPNGGAKSAWLRDELHRGGGMGAHGARDQLGPCRRRPSRCDRGRLRTPRRARFAEPARLGTLGAALPQQVRAAHALPGRRRRPARRARHRAGLHGNRAGLPVAPMIPVFTAAAAARGGADLRLRPGRQARVTTPGKAPSTCPRGRCCASGSPARPAQRAAGGPGLGRPRGCLTCRWRCPDRFTRLLVMNTGWAPARDRGFKPVARLQQHRSPTSPMGKPPQRGKPA